MANSATRASAEATLVRSCLRHFVGGDVGKPVRDEDIPSINWAKAARLAARGNVLGVVTHTLQETGVWPLLPSSARSVVERETLRARFQQIRVEATLALLAPLFERHGVPWVVLKGTAHARALFANTPAARWFVDIDLLVPESAVDTACRLIESLGWDRTWHPHVHYKIRRSKSNFIYRHPRRPRVEVHWDVHDSKLVGRFPCGDPAALVARAQPLRLDGVSAPLKRLSNEDMLGAICAHMVLGDSFQRTLDAVELVLLLRRFGDQLDWQYLGDAARRAGTTRVIRAALETASAILDMPIGCERELRRVFRFRPSGWSERTARTFAVLRQPLVRSSGWEDFRFPFSDRMQGDLSAAVWELQRVLFGAALLDRPRDWAAAVRVLAAPPGDYLAVTTNRPEELVWLYYLVHPLILAMALAELPLAGFVPSRRPDSGVARGPVAAGPQPGVASGSTSCLADRGAHSRQCERAP